jgi:hypothetical protein
MHPRQVQTTRQLLIAILEQAVQAQELRRRRRIDRIRIDLGEKHQQAANRADSSPNEMLIAGGNSPTTATSRSAWLTTRSPHHQNRRPGAVATVPRYLQRTCSGPPADSPSGCPKCHGSPGASRPPSITPSTSSACKHAAPRAHRTHPEATNGRHRARAPRCSGVAYNRASSPRRANRVQVREQNRWFGALATNSRPHRSHQRVPNERPAQRRQGRADVDPVTLARQEEAATHRRLYRPNLRTVIRVR